MNIMSYVTYKGQNYYVKDGKLKVNKKEIRDIAEIEGLETLTELQKLDLSDNQITEIKGLDTLTNLQELNLMFNRITEVNGLEMFTILRLLNLSVNKIEKIKGLKTLTELHNLLLGMNRITKIDGLGMLINLKGLSLGWNQIHEITGLNNLTELRLLDLSYNKIYEIKGLGMLTNLERLNLQYNKIQEIKELGMLTNLKSLTLKDNPIKEQYNYLLKKTPQEIVEFCRLNDPIIFEFDFAFSFAGEDREIVEKLYKSLIKRGFKVFYDRPFEWYLAGKDLNETFKEIYGEKSKYVVAFISEYYPKKKWTDFERQIAEKVAESREEEYIIPIRLDDTISYGIKSSIGHINYHQKGTKAVANILEKKLKDFNKRHNIPSNISLDEDIFNNEDKFDKNGDFIDDEGMNKLKG